MKRDMAIGMRRAAAGLMLGWLVPPTFSQLRKYERRATTTARQRSAMEQDAITGGQRMRTR